MCIAVLYASSFQAEHSTSSMKQFNIFGEDSTSDSKEDDLIMALSDLSSSEDDSNVAIWSSPPLSAAPVLVADLQANNDAAREYRGKILPSKVARASTHCCAVLEAGAHRFLRLHQPAVDDLT